jgi:hypothetical protein
MSDEVGSPHQKAMVYIRRDPGAWAMVKFSFWWDNQRVQGSNETIRSFGLLSFVLAGQHIGLKSVGIHE